MNNTSTYKAAALTILKKSEKALSAREIVVEAIKLKLIKPEGKTPEASMAARIYTDIKNNTKSKFIKSSKGKFRLRASSPGTEKNAEELIEEHNNKTIESLKKRLENMDPFIFEQMIGDLLANIGYEDVQVTKRSSDGGIDVIANLRTNGLTDVNTIVQVKKYTKSNIPDKVIRELRGSAEVGQRGLIITTSDFTKPAIKEAKAEKKMPISLVNGKKLIELLDKYEVGIKKEKREIVTIDSDYFTSLEMQDNQLSSTEKSMSIWPLPGGIFNYFDALVEIIDKINTCSSKEKIIEWFRENYENVESEKTIKGYLQVLRSLGLTYHEKLKIGLTSLGKSFCKNPDKELLLSNIEERIFGFSEVIEFLEENSESKSEIEVLDYLNNSFEVDWKSTAQTTYRLLWLCNLGKVKRDEDGKYLIIK